jgi:hypothetical protein
MSTKIKLIAKLTNENEGAYMQRGVERQNQLKKVTTI